MEVTPLYYNALALHGKHPSVRWSWKESILNCILLIILVEDNKIAFSRNISLLNNVPVLKAPNVWLKGELSVSGKLVYLVTAWTRGPLLELRKDSSSDVRV